MKTAASTLSRNAPCWCATAGCARANPGRWHCSSLVCISPRSASPTPAPSDSESHPRRSPPLPWEASSPRRPRVSHELQGWQRRPRARERYVRIPWRRNALPQGPTMSSLHHTRSPAHATGGVGTFCTRCCIQISARRKIFGGQGAQHPRIRVQETGCGVVWLCPLRFADGKGGGMKRLVLLFAALLIVGCGEQSLSGSTIEKALEEAVELDSLQVRGDLYYQPYKWKPYSGWVKETYDSGRVEMLWQVKDGKEDGLWTKWHENGQKANEGTYEHGKINGLWTWWYENGQKEQASTFKDGEPDGLHWEWHENGRKKYEDGQYWNSSGEEVETSEEALK